MENPHRGPSHLLMYRSILAHTVVVLVRLHQCGSIVREISSTCMITNIRLPDRSNALPALGLGSTPSMLQPTERPHSKKPPRTKQSVEQGLECLEDVEALHGFEVTRRVQH